MALNSFNPQDQVWFYYAINDDNFSRIPMFSYKNEYYTTLSGIKKTSTVKYYIEAIRNSITFKTPQGNNILIWDLPKKFRLNNIFLNVNDIYIMFYIFLAVSLIYILTFRRLRPKS